MLNGSLPPHCGAPKCCGQKEWPPAAKANAEYAVADSQDGMRDADNCSPQKINMLRDVTLGLGFRNILWNE
jgi:hypothetical protein